jgi:hypothetical protein
MYERGGRGGREAGAHSTTPTYTVKRDSHAREPSWSALWLQKQSILRACMREEDAGGRFWLSRPPLCSRPILERWGFSCKHRRMQTVLQGDGPHDEMGRQHNVKHAVNIHFGNVNETRKVLGYIDDLTLDDVLKSVRMATLKASANRTLRDAYHHILDDLDDDKELTFALMQQ